MVGRAIVRLSTYDEALAWFGQHQDDPEAVFIPIGKKGGALPTPTYDELVEIALIHGWIDGQKQGLDDDCYLLAFSPRRARSPWSKINRDKVEALMAAGAPAARRPRCGRAGEDQRPVGRGVRRAAGLRAAGRLPGGAGGRPTGAGVLRHPQPCQPLRRLLPDQRCQASGDQGPPHRHVRRDVRPGRATALRTHSTVRADILRIVRPCNTIDEANTAPTPSPARIRRDNNGSRPNSRNTSACAVSRDC